MEGERRREKIERIVKIKYLDRSKKREDYRSAKRKDRREVREKKDKERGKKKINQIILTGVTGPVLVYDEALYQFTSGAGIEFLPCRFWIAVWSAIIAILVAAFQGSVVVKYFTKFTKDIFAGFVATVFIYEALLQTVGVSLYSVYCRFGTVL